MYDTASPKREIRIKTQNLQSPWITKDFQDSSKRKQNYLVNSLKIEKLYIRSITIYLEKFFKKSETSYYFNKLKFFEGEIKMRWKLMEKVIVEKRRICDYFCKKLIINQAEIMRQKLLLKHLTTFF